MEHIKVGTLVPSHHLFPLDFPYIVEKFLVYLFSISLALALLNALPVYGTDGYYAWKGIWEEIRQWIHFRLEFIGKAVPFVVSVSLIFRIAYSLFS